jgi:hypothetical protein
MTVQKYCIKYKGRKIYKDLSAEDCTEVLQDLSERFYNGEDIHPDFIEVEEMTYGAKE